MLSILITDFRRFKIYDFGVTSSGVTYTPRYVKICQLVRNFKGETQTRGQRIDFIGPRLALSIGSGLKGGLPQSRPPAS
jgi:hypothetical protein